ncbi:MAG: DNA starvation/stationary phase protection protein [Verrucomicrobia bacterium]|nr:DNA starvation/stationary phase protection protein [Verrucomicrobiota bacterium]
MERPGQSISKSGQTPSQFAAANSLGLPASDAITKAMNPLVADAFALYVKTKNYHWHVSGPSFRDYHLLFDEQAEQIFAMIDPLAERVRKLGGTTIRSVGEIQKQTAVADDNDASVEPREMIGRLLEDNRRFADALRKAHDVCEKYKDVASTSVLEIFLDETERRIWFLNSVIV